MKIGVRLGRGGGGCEHRIGYLKCKKKSRGGAVGGGGGVQGGCEQTIEGGVRVDVYKQLELL